MSSSGQLPFDQQGSLEPTPDDVPATRSSGPDARKPGGMTHHTLGAMLWMLSGKTIQNIFKLLVMVILARLLLPADFGLASLAMLVANFATSLSVLGMGPAVVQRSNLEARHIRTAFTFSVALGFFLFVLVVLLAPAISSFFEMEGLTPILYTLAVTLPLANASVVAHSLLRRELQFRAIAIREVVAYLVGYAVVGVTLAALGFGAWALVAAAMGQILTQTVLMLVARPHPKRPLFDTEALRDLLHFGAGVTLRRLATFWAARGDKLVVGKLLGVDALGFYGRAHALAQTSVTVFSRVMDTVLFSAMARIQSEKDRLFVAYRRGVAFTGLAFLPASGILFLLAPEIVTVLLGPGWEDAVVPFQVLSIGIFLRPSYRMSSTFALAMGHAYQSAWRTAVYAALVFGGAGVGARWGLPGVAAGVLAALGINVLLSTQLTLRLLSMGWVEFLRALGPGAFVAIVAFVETWIVAEGMRSLGATPVLTLLIAVVTVGVTLLLLLLAAPGLVLGPDGRWMLKSIAPYLPRRPRILRSFHARLENRLRPAA